VARPLNYFLVAVLAAALVFPPGLAHATLENEMRGMFNSMINITDGGYHKSMGRGVVAGPSMVVRNSRVRTDLINFVPPSIDAGCGGIDMFLGSFSFINADQFINLMQAIAANAAGYAFKIALDTMCPTCGQVIGKLQDLMQKMNAMAGDSCQVAMTAVNFLADKAGANELAKNIEQGPLGALAQSVGAQVDAFSTWLDKYNSRSNTQSLSANEVKELLGNIAWKVLQKNNFITTAFSSGDHELAEALMSFTGTVIGVKDGDADTPRITEHPSLLTAQDLLRGGGNTMGMKKYNCPDGDCLHMSQSAYTFKGLEKFVEEVLLGADGAAGPDSLIFKLNTNSGSLTEKEKQLVRVTPYHATRLRNMALCTYNTGVGSLAEYSRKASRLIALEILQKYLSETISAIMAASQTGTNIGGTNMPYGLSPKFMANLRDLQKQVQVEFSGLQENLTGNLEQIYQSAIVNCNLKPLTIRDLGG